mmetsp:Transcript_66346/g.209730  ORF Transcript_66346/g.209730 Transcript_66346/m.209730 type:complete len:258 (+) Transcript_66346:2155-2928(+)
MGTSLYSKQLFFGLYTWYLLSSALHWRKHSQFFTPLIPQYIVALGASETRQAARDSSLQEGPVRPTGQLHHPSGSMHVPWSLQPAGHAVLKTSSTTLSGSSATVFVRLKYGSPRSAVDAPITSSFRGLWGGPEGVIPSPPISSSSPVAAHAILGRARAPSCPLPCASSRNCFFSLPCGGLPPSSPLYPPCAGRSRWPPLPDAMAPPPTTLLETTPSSSIFFLRRMISFFISSYSSLRTVTVKVEASDLVAATVVHAQ